MEAGAISAHPIDPRLENTYAEDFEWVKRSRQVDQPPQLSLPDTQSPDPHSPGSSPWPNRSEFLLQGVESETPHFQSNQHPFSPSPSRVEVSSLSPVSSPRFDYPNHLLQPPLKHVYMENNQNTRKRSAASHDDEGLVSRVPKTRKRSITPYDNKGLSSRSEITARAPSKIPHSIIEAKYRTNLNSKIETLRASVPFWGLAAGEDESAAVEDADMSIDRRSKANVLENATQYILHLEKVTRRISMEMQDLKDRIGR
ncbi:hypothetical protein MMC14_008161 [Varicellaria rhodocarpa]|nr:hypothetical protein [Varicellaria rhodocarpa]